MREGRVGNGRTAAWPSIWCSIWCSIGVITTGLMVASTACTLEVDRCGAIQPRNEHERVLCTDQGDAVLARVAVPSGDPPPGGWPGVVLLHGSSGLFRPNDVVTAAATGEPCSAELHGRFAQWEQQLTDLGYAVIMPASFASRGYCDADEDPTTAFLPAEVVDRERLVDRSYDAAAAARFLCEDGRVDCRRLAALGFSNGASVALLMLHEDLGDAEDPRLQALERPRFAAGVAYYPGCGLERQLASGLDPAQIERYLFPTGPMWVPHAGKDRLVDDCELLRDPQVDEVAARRKIAGDRFQLRIYGEADHGFDGADDGDSSSDRWARDDAQTQTLAKLDEWLVPAGGAPQ